MRSTATAITTISLVCLLTFAAHGAQSINSSIIPIAAERFAAFDRGNGTVGVEVVLPRLDDFQLLRLLEEQNRGAFKDEAAAKWVVIPDGGDLTFRVTGGERQVVDRLPNGRLSRRTVDDLAEPVGVSVGRPVHLRGVRLAPVTIQRSVEHHGSLIVNERVQIELTVDREALVTSPHKAPVTRPFATVFEGAVANPPLRDPAAADRGRMLVLYNDNYRDNAGIAAINRWVEWKRDMGLDVAVETVDFPDQDQDDVRDLVRDYYADERSLDYLVIIGYDSTIVGLDSIAVTRQLWFPNYRLEIEVDPPLVSRGDHWYAAMDGDDDVVPDILFGRMVVINTATVSGVLNRSEIYERDPFPGPQGREGEWFRRALVTSDKDAAQSPEATDFLHWIPHRLYDMGYEDVDSVFNVTYAQAVEPTREALERGVSIAFGDGWLLGAADPEDMNDLAQNGRMSPLVIASMQHYGFPVIPRWFAKATVNAPLGPVAAFGFDFDPWVVFLVDMMGWAAYGLQYNQITNGGELHLFSHLNIIPGMFRVQSEEQTIHDLGFSCYLGDPTVNIFTAPPVDMELADEGAINSGATLVRLPILDDEGNGVQGATVCIRQGEDINYVTVTDAEGIAAFTIPDGLAEGELRVTAFKHNYRPIHTFIEVADQPINIVLEQGGIDDSGGDDDGELSNGETARLVFVFRNVGDNAAQNLTAQLTSDSPHITFSRDDPAVQNLAAGATGTFTQPVNITLNPRCPDGTTVRIEAVVSAGDSRWRSAFEIVTVGPKFTVNQAGGQDLARGRQGTLRPDILNRGSRASTALQAVLTSLHPAITVQAGNTDLPAVPAGEARPVNAAFQVTVDSTFVPGNVAMFNLRLFVNEGMDTTLTFGVQIGVRGEDDPVGPDEYGYVAIDNGDAQWRDRPWYEWIEVNPDVPGYDFLGTEIDLPNNQQDSLDISASVALPFEFTYYGESFDSITICSNGWLAMGAQWARFGTAVNQPMPGVLAADGQIAAFWQDLRILNNLTNGVFTHYMPERGLFIIEWSNMFIPIGREGFDSVSVQVWLHDPAVYQTPTGDGEITIQYKRAPIVDFGYFAHHFATVGIRSVDGRGGLTYTHANEYAAGARPLQDSLAIKFTTASQLEVGRVVGRVVEADDTTRGVPEVIVNPQIAPSVVTDAQGRFEFPALRAQVIENVLVSKQYYNTVSIAFEVRANETVTVPTVRLPRPIFSLDEVSDTLTPSLRPDGHRTQAYAVVFNLGTGPLEYAASLRYFDGGLPDFDTARVFHLNAAIGQNDLQCYGGAWADGAFYVPGYIRNNPNPPIFVLDRNGRVIRQFRQPTPADEFNAVVMYSIAWDGEKFWGGYSYLDRNYLIAFNPIGELLDTIPHPFEGELRIFSVTFSPERGTLFATDWGRDVVELNLEGEVIARHRVHFPGRNSQVSGLGWNPHDMDGMPLYLLDTYYAVEGEQRPRLLKMNPETGETVNVGILPVGGVEPKAYYGIITLTDWNAEQTYIGVVEKFGLTRNTRVFLKLHTAGPNLKFMVPGSFFNRRGLVQPHSPMALGIELDATGLPEGEYRYAYLIRHNAEGDSVVVPVTLTVDEESSTDGDAPPPIGFALTGLYPNPFNGRMTLTFTLSRQAAIELRLIDITGRTAAEVAVGRASPGRHTLTLNADHLSTGVYILQLKAEGLGIMRTKAVLVK